MVGVGAQRGESQKSKSHLFVVFLNSALEETRLVLTFVDNSTFDGAVEGTA